MTIVKPTMGTKLTTSVGSSQMSAAASVHLQNPDQFFLKPLEKGKGMVIPALSIREDKVRNATVQFAYWLDRQYLKSRECRCNSVCRDSIQSRRKSARNADLE